MGNNERRFEEDQAYDRATTAVWTHASARRDWGFEASLVIAVVALLLIFA